MAKIKLVTGFVPVPGHPRTPQEYHVLGARLDDVRVSISKSIISVEDCWLWQFVQDIPNCTHSAHDNPRKNTMAYHASGHQKFEWLARAACLDSDPDIFIWIDYGIFHLGDITVEIIDKFLFYVSNSNYKEISIPGCWTAQQMQEGLRASIPDTEPCWRFCGGLMIVPRALVFPLYSAARNDVEHHILKTRNASWDVNTLARLEMKQALPIRWYQADHNKTMFTGF